MFTTTNLFLALNPMKISCAWRKFGIRLNVLSKGLTKYHFCLSFFSLYLHSKIWDSLSGEELHSFTHKHIVKSVDFDDDGTQLLTGSNEKLLRIFDLNQPEAGKCMSLTLLIRFVRINRWKLKMVDIEYLWRWKYRNYPNVIWNFSHCTILSIKMHFKSSKTYRC